MERGNDASNFSTERREAHQVGRLKRRSRMAPEWLYNSIAQLARPPRTAAEDIHTVYKSPRLCVAEKSVPRGFLEVVFTAQESCPYGTYPDTERDWCPTYETARSEKKQQLLAPECSIQGRETPTKGATYAKKPLIESRPVRGSGSATKLGLKAPECRELRRYITRRLKTPCCVSSSS